jgi:hypothetical protein
MDLEDFPYLNTMLSNLKNALRGRYQKAGLIITPTTT